MRLSIIVPVLNEAARIGATLESLQSYREAGHEVIVVDGGSDDATIAIAKPLADSILISGPGRATQMNMGAAQATGDCLVFLHADTRLPPGGAAQLQLGLAETRRHWGRFDVKLSGDSWLLRLVALMMNWRSRLTGMATGDQAIFVLRSVFERAGGFADIALMEDVELSKRLKRVSRPLCISDPVITSSRRWEERGVWSTILLMWWLRLLYFLGVSPARLVQHYYPARSTGQKPAPGDSG